MMHNMYQDYDSGSFIPDIEVTRITPTGPYRARSMGLESIHIDQAQAVNDLTQKIQDGLASGEIHPNC